MKFINNILGRLFAIWAIVVFVISLLLVLIPIAITGLWPEPKRSVLMHSVIQVWLSSFFILVGVRKIIKGKENFKIGKNYVVVCNHNSFMDVPLTSPGIPGPNKTIAKIEMARIPIFGIIYRRGSVLVDRKSDRSRKESYLKMKEVLNMGLHMCIYPEGTRNKSGAPLQKFQDGAFRLATDTGTPVMPSVIFHTAKVLPPKKRFYFWPHKVEMHFLPPVSSTDKSSLELKETVFSMMKEYYEQNNY